MPPITPIIPDHELIRCIGSGSYGEVWLARNVMGNYRAVKVVYRKTFENDRPFEREFTGIKKFEPISRSDNSQVDILHIGRNDDCFYYVMELADDQTRGQQIDPDSYSPKTLSSETDQRDRLPIAECLEIGLALSAALEHLHKNGLVHRDVKPSNVIFVNGIPKLADIGLVTDASATMSFVGTEGFLPPEGPGTAQADIYSLGKVLYEISTGKDRKEFPEPPTMLGEFADREKYLELSEIIKRACDRDIRKRYFTAEAMRADLSLLENGKSIRQTHLWKQRRADVVKRGILVGTLLAVATGAYLVVQDQTRKSRAAANMEAAFQKQAKANSIQGQQIIHSWEATAAAVAKSSSAALIFSDRRAAEEILSQLKNHPEVIEAGLYANNQTLLAEFKSQENNADLPESSPPFGTQIQPPFLTICVPINEGNRRVGIFYFRLKLNSSVEEKKSELKRPDGLI
jgi:serine/threonine protein kinase